MQCVWGGAGRVLGGIPGYLENRGSKPSLGAIREGFLVEMISGLRLRVSKIYPKEGWV